MANTHTVSVYVYSVKAHDKSRSMEHVLRQVSGDDLGDRARLVSQALVRAERVEQQQGLWLMDFVLMRYEGPAKVSPDGPARDFDLDEDDRFGEETAALYDPELGRLYVQYNHRGVRVGRIVEYFTSYEDGAADAFEYLPVYEDGTAARLSRMKSTRALTVGVATDSLSSVDREGGLSLHEAMSLHQNLGGNYVEITVKARWMPQGLLSKAKNVAKGLMDRSSSPESAIRKLEVTGEDEETAEVYTLDLIEQRKTFRDELVPGAGRRLDANQRFKLLKKARQHMFGAGRGGGDDDGSSTA